MTVTEAAPPAFLCRANAELETKGDGRTVYGIAVPFDRSTIVNDGWGPYTETFKRGAFAKWLRENKDRTTKLMVNHDKRRFGIGRATLLREDVAGLYGEFRISQTNEGDDALTLVRDGVVDAFSVGFEGVKDRKSADGVVERTEVILREVSLVSFPAYESALVAGVRHHFNVSDDELARLIELVRSEPGLMDRLAEAVASTTDTSAPEAVTAPDEGTSEPAEATRSTDDDAAEAPVEPTHSSGTSLDELRRQRELMGRRLQLVLRDQGRYQCLR